MDGEFFHGVPLGFIRTTPEGVVLEVNQNAASLLGMNADELVGRQAVDFYWDARDRQDLVSRVRAGAGSVVPFEVQLRHADGHPVWIWAAVDVQRDQQGKPTELHVVFGESQRLSRTVSRLENGLERLRRLNEIFYHAVRADKEQDFLDYVQGALRAALQVDMVAIRIERQDAEPFLVGCPGPFDVDFPREILEGALAISDCGMLADSDGPLARFCRVMAGSGIASLLSLRAGGHGRSDGASKDAGVSPSVLLLLGARRVRRWKDEEVGFAQTVALEVAEVMDRLSLMEQRTLQAGFIEELLDLAPVGILVLADDMVVVRANCLGREILVQTDEEWDLGRPVPQPFLVPLSRIRKGGQEQIGPLFLPVEGRFFELSSRRFDMGQGREGLVVVVLDVTDRERIRNLAESQERLASLGRFAAGIAHDFNNLLTGIVGYAQLSLQEEEVSDPVRENLLVIARQGRKAAKLVRQITDYGRQSLLVKDVLDLRELVRQTCALMSRTLPETVTLETRITTGSCLVHADRGRLDQVLANLVLNASDAVQGRGKLRVTLDVHKGGQRGPEADGIRGPSAYLAIEDDGPGIPPDLRAKVFEPFFTTKAMGEGTGLGLSQVYGIVKQHGGFIDIGDSDMGGAAVRIWLPLLQAEGVPGTLQRESSDRMELVPRGDGKRILLVEDDAAVRRAISRMAQSLGYDVLTSGSVDEALGILEEVNFGVDLVLTDVVMPGKGGLDLAKALVTRAPGMPCVLVSGYPLHSKEVSTDAVSIVGWLEKPVDMVRLGRALAEAFEKISE